MKLSLIEHDMFLMKGLSLSKGACNMRGVPIRVNSIKEGVIECSQVFSPSPGKTIEIKGSFTRMPSGRSLPGNFFYDERTNG